MGGLKRRAPYGPVSAPSHKQQPALESEDIAYNQATLRLPTAPLRVSDASQRGSPQIRTLSRPGELRMGPGPVSNHGRSFATFSSSLQCKHTHATQPSDCFTDPPLLSAAPASLSEVIKSASATFKQAKMTLVDLRFPLLAHLCSASSAWARAVVSPPRSLSRCSFVVSGELHGAQKLIKRNRDASAV